MGSDDAGVLLARDVLRQVFPGDCRQVGSENLMDICRGHRDFDQPDDGGFRLSFGDSLELLANAAGVISTLLAIYLFVGGTGKRRLSLPADVDKAILEALPDAAAIPREKRLELYLALVAISERDVED